jgi:hypothetical protein
VLANRFDNLREGMQARFVGGSSPEVALGSGGVAAPAPSPR